MSHYQHSLKSAIETFAALREIEPALIEASEMVAAALSAGHKLLLCGNGGSAADAAHISTEFVCRFKEDRRPYPAIALGVDGGLLTAISNDYEFRDVFSRQVRAFGQEGDILIAITTSGKSRNILDALEEARRLKVQSIALLGKGGGFTAGAADLEIVVPGVETARIQEAQHFLLHVLCELVEARLPKE